jgi:hydroxymethylpyrimidine pyrophosphatase-like HAD family hydrolase
MPKADRFRLIALDIDGTVTDSRHEVRPRVRAAIRAALDAGIEVWLATGRVVSTTRPVAQAIDARLGLMTNNGAVCQPRVDAAPLWERLLPAGVAREAEAAYRAVGFVPIAFAGPGAPIAVPRRDLIIDAFLCRFGDAIIEVGDVGAWIDDDLLMLTTMAGADAEAERRVREQTVAMGARFADRATVLPLWHPLYGSWILDVIAPHCGKWPALLEYAALRDIDPSAILAIGDGLNDVPMVAGAGLGVAMGQCGPELRAVADAVVADNDHDGVAEALERFVL